MPLASAITRIEEILAATAPEAVAVSGRSIPVGPVFNTNVFRAGFDVHNLGGPVHYVMVEITEPENTPFTTGEKIDRIYDYAVEFTNAVKARNANLTMLIYWVTGITTDMETDGDVKAEIRIPLCDDYPR